MVQNSAARVVKKAKKRDHITPVLKALHWLPVKQRIDYKICLIVYKCLHKLAPSYLSDSLKRYVPTRTLRSSSDPSILIVPDYSYKYIGGRSFFSYAPSVWNKLPTGVRNSESLAVFKKRLKHHLFLNAYTCT